jgi:photosystem II stability/assembly factor-like uncharacterized protein
MKTTYKIRTLLTYAVGFAWMAMAGSCAAKQTGEPDSVGGWSHTGIGGGGAMFGPAVSPHDPEVAFVSCDMGGSFVTHDGGASWRMFSLSRMVNFFVFDPLDPQTVYAHSLGLFKSTDLGRTWRLVYPKPSETAGVISRGDHAGEIIVTGDSTRRTVQALAIDPSRSERMYAAIRIDQSVAVYVTDDGGNEWKKEKEMEGDIKAIFIDPSSPAARRTVYVASENGIERKQNGRWHSKYPANIRFNSFAGGYGSTAGKYVLYAISGTSYFNTENVPQGIYYSEDGGRTWENRQDGLLRQAAPGTPPPEWRAVGTGALHPEVVYVSYGGLFIHPDTSCMGVARSEDFGKTWTLSWQDKLTKGKSIVSPNFGDDWLNERFGPAWGENPFALGVSPAAPDICYGSDFGRTVKTSDGGKTWEPVYTKRQPGGGWTTRGLEVTTGYHIVFDPFDDRHVFQALTDIGLIESVDGGKSWNSATGDNGVPPAWVNTTYWMTFDPEVKGRGWAVMSGTHDLPRPKMFRRTGIAGYKGGILLTADAGKTWKPVSAAIGEAAMTHILFDPASSREARTLYACAFGKGVYKSTDGGTSWQEKNRGIESSEPFAWRIERRDGDGTLFLVVSRRSEDGSTGNDMDGGLYKSADGAETWIKMALPEGCNGPTCLLADRDHPRKLILSAWGRISPGDFSPDTGGGIFLSDDDGETWRQVLSKDQHIHDISFDPRSGRYYACGFNASAYYSEDGAETWKRIGGFNFKWGKRVEPDPKDPEKIYVITFGGGTWHGPAKGDGQAMEDMIIPFSDAK